MTIHFREREDSERETGIISRKFCKTFILHATNYPCNSMELSPSSETTSCTATQEFPNIFGTRKFITVFTRALNQSLS
jgi:hypothetical protein